MSATVGVLARVSANLRALVETRLRGQAASDVRAAYQELDEASAAFAELIEADRQYDEARAAWPRAGTRAEYKAAQERCDAAVARRAAALAKVQPCKA